MKHIKTIGLLATFGLLLGGCKAGTAEVNPHLSLKNQETLAFQATTSLTLLRDLEVPSRLSRMQYKENLNDFEVPIATLDLLFTNGNDFKVESKASDREDYTNLDVVSFKIFDDERMTYYLYYNTYKGTQDDQDENLFPSEETSEGTPIFSRAPEYKEKTKIKVRGIALVNDEEYRFMSMTEVENEGDEHETEMKFMLFKDDGNFISIKQEIEVEGTPGDKDYEYEEEFSYMVVKDGVKTSHFKLEIEKEDGEHELEVKIDGLKYDVEYRYIEDKTFIHVKTNGHGTYIYEKVVIIDEETGNVSVEYLLQ